MVIATRKVTTMITSGIGLPIKLRRSGIKSLVRNQILSQIERGRSSFVRMVLGFIGVLVRSGTGGIPITLLSPWGGGGGVLKNNKKKNKKIKIWRFNKKKAK